MVFTVSYDKINSLTNEQLISIILRFSDDVKSLFNKVPEYTVINRIEDNIDALCSLNNCELIGFAKGILKPESGSELKGEIYIGKRRSQTRLFEKLVYGQEILESDKSILCELFLARFSTSFFCMSNLSCWFSNLDIKKKSIILLTLYLEIEESEEKQEQEEKSPDEDLVSVEYTTKSYDDYELVTCNGCGNTWDGFAQCPCSPEIISEDEVENSVDETLVSKHPSYWSPTNHYGMCGQNCPCCRAQNNDVFGACPYC